MDLYGDEISGAELRRRVGHLSQVGGVRLLTSDNGPSRGVRLIEFRTGTGLSFEIGVERGFDIGRADYRATQPSWTMASVVALEPQPVICHLGPLVFGLKHMNPFHPAGLLFRFLFLFLLLLEQWPHQYMRLR
jgi:hypothetical protein